MIEIQIINQNNNFNQFDLMRKNLINLSNLVVRPNDQGYCTDFSVNRFKVINKQ